MTFREKLLKLFFPSRCVICDSIMKDGELLCAECEKYRAKPYPGRGACNICAQKKSACACGTRLYYEKLCAPFFYTGKAKSSVHRYKFRGRTDLAEPYSRYMEAALAERNLTDDIDIITYIPMPKKSRFLRGYNQAQLLAENLAEKTGKSCETLLYRFYASHLQHSLGAIRRRGNILGAFEPPKDTIPLFRGKTVFIADDIVTSGATLNEAAKTLLIFGAEKVYCAAVMMPPPKNADSESVIEHKRKA